MRATSVGVDLRDAPHLPAPRLRIGVGSAPPHRLARQALVRGRLDHLAGEQVQRPSGAARRRVSQAVATSGLPPCRSLRSRGRNSSLSPLQVALHEPPFGAVHRRAADADTGCDLLVADAGVRRQQDLRSLEFARRLPAPLRRVPSSSRWYWSGSRDNLRSWPPSCSEAQSNRQVNQLSGGHKPGFTPTPGPVSRLHRRLHARQPQAARRSRHPAPFRRHPAVRP